MARIKIIILLVLICRYVYSSSDDFTGRGLGLGLHRACVISSPEALLSNPAGLYGIPTSEYILTYDFKENKRILLTNQPLLMIEGANIGFGFVKKSGLKKYILGLGLFKTKVKKIRPIFVGANIKLKEGEERGLGFDLGCLYVGNKIDAGIVLHNLGFDDNSKNNVIVGINYKLNKFSTMISYDRRLSLATELYMLKQPLTIIRIGLHNMGITFGVATKLPHFIVDYGYYSKDNLNIISIRLK